MYPVSDLFQTVIRGTHRLASYVEVWSNTGGNLGHLPFSDGTVSFDRGSAIRSRLDVTAEFSPNLSTVDDVVTIDALTIYGTELRPFRGMRSPDGPEEVGPLGRFIITDVPEPFHDTSIALNAQDYTIFVADDRF